MAAARLAPVLSATSRMERICSILGFLGGYFDRFGVAFDHFDEAPAFGSGKRAAFLDADAVTLLGLALFVVRIKFVELRHDFFELWMRETALHPDNDGLCHLGGDDLADAFLAVAAVAGRRHGRGGGGWGVVWHRCQIRLVKNSDSRLGLQAALVSFRSWLMRVSMRAMSWRSSRKRPGF